jgi:hypothetical protein
MRKPIRLTGAPSVADPGFDQFRTALRKQLLKVAATHSQPHTRALFQWMADGRKGAPPTRDQHLAKAPEPNPAPAPVAKAPEPRRAPPPRPAFKRPTALAK